MRPIYHRVALIGLGLIAGSMAHAMRRGGLAGEIVGTARSARTRAVAREIALCDRIADTAAEAVAGADLVALCVPVGAMAAVAEAIAPHLAHGATVTDVGSVKRAVIGQVAPHLPDHVRFVPAHPLAGTEQSGPRSGFAELFDDRYVLLTPVAGTPPEAVARLRALWEGCGATVEEMDAAHHDLVLAVTSHTPHLIAYTMVGVADDLRRVTDSEVVRYSAAGFREFTRIAASDASSGLRSRPCITNPGMGALAARAARRKSARLRSVARERPPVGDGGAGGRAAVMDGKPRLVRRSGSCGPAPGARSGSCGPPWSPCARENRGGACAPGSRAEMSVWASVSLRFLVAGAPRGRATTGVFVWNRSLRPRAGRVNVANRAIPA